MRRSIFGANSSTPHLLPSILFALPLARSRNAFTGPASERYPRHRPAAAFSPSRFHPHKPSHHKPTASSQSSRANDLTSVLRRTSYPTSRISRIPASVPGSRPYSPVTNNGSNLPDQQSPSVPVNTAKTHSPLFVQLSTRILCNTPTKDARTRFVTSRKRREVRRKRSKRVIFNEFDNIYRPKKYKPKMMACPTAVEVASAEWSENLNTTMMCKDCKEVPPNLVEEFSSGDMVCGSCGLVLGDRIVDTRSEWRTFANDDQGNDDPSRVGDGANPLLNGSQLTTTISFQDGNARSRDLMRTQNKSTNDKATKGLLAAYKEIGAHCDAIALPRSVNEAAKALYKKVDDAKAFRGKSQEAIIAGIIFIACRHGNQPRTFAEIFALTKVEKKDIGRVFKALEKFFANPKNEAKTSAAGTGMSTDEYQTTTSHNAKDLCIRFCSQLGLNKAQFVTVSEGLAEKVPTVNDLAGRSPLSVASACIFMAAALLGKPKTTKEIARVVGVSDGTIRTAYKYLYQERERLIEPSWIAPDGKIQGSMDLLPVG